MDTDTDGDPDRNAATDTATMGRAMTDPFPGRFLERLTDAGDRMGGHPGERRAAELVASALADRLREADAEAGMRAAGIWPDGW